MSPRCGGLGFRVLCKPARIPFMASGPCFRTRSRTLAVALVGNTFLSCTQWVRAKLNDPGVTNWVHVAGRHRCSNGSDIVRRLAGGCRPTPRRQFGFHSRVVRCASAICSRAKPAQRRRARENSGPKPAEPEPKTRQAFEQQPPSAVRAILDDPPIHIRPNSSRQTRVQG